MEFISSLIIIKKKKNTIEECFIHYKNNKKETKQTQTQNKIQTSNQIILK